MGNGKSQGARGAAKRIVAATNSTYSNGCGEVTIPDWKYLTGHWQHWVFCQCRALTRQPGSGRIFFRTICSRAVLSLHSFQNRGPTHIAPCNFRKAKNVK